MHLHPRILTAALLATVFSFVSPGLSSAGDTTEYEPKDQANYCLRCRGLHLHGHCCPHPGEADEIRLVWQVVVEPVCIPGPHGHCGKVRMVKRVIPREIRTRVPVTRWDIEGIDAYHTHKPPHLCSPQKSADEVLPDYGHSPDNQFHLPVPVVSP
jgi:hypothetical protein